MANYNLSDNVQEDFPFVLRGKDYIMRYPRTEEIEKIQGITTQLEDAQDEKNKDEVARLSKELEGYLYNFISPVGHETNIQDALKKENIKVMRNFNTMIKAELAIS